MDVPSHDPSDLQSPVLPPGVTTESKSCTAKTETAQSTIDNKKINNDESCINIATELAGEQFHKAIESIIAQAYINSKRASQSQISVSTSSLFMTELINEMLTVEIIDGKYFSRSSNGSLISRVTAYMDNITYTAVFNIEAYNPNRAAVLATLLTKYFRSDDDKLPRELNDACERFCLLEPYCRIQASRNVFNSTWRQLFDAITDAKTETESVSASYVRNILDIIGKFVRSFLDLENLIIPIITNTKVLTPSPSWYSPYSMHTQGFGCPSSPSNSGWVYSNAEPENPTMRK